MKKVDINVLKDAANRLLFGMSEEEFQTLLHEFDILVKQMELIGEVDGLENYSPMTFPFDASTSYLREDIAGNTLDTSEALKNAKNVKDGQIKLPKVVL